MLKIKRVISGGQTGADQGALDAVMQCGMNYGGWIPKGRKTEAGPLASHYQMQEHWSGDYRKRTEKNILNSDGTLIVSHGPLSGGSALTLNIAKNKLKPCFHADLNSILVAQAVYNILLWLQEKEIFTLNVAGPRASSDPYIYRDTKELILLLLE